MGIQEVREALWKAYKEAEKSEDGIEGKTSEAYCELMFPTYWDCSSLEEFCQPIGIMVYSYALGPSRRHFFFRGEEETHPNYYTWYSPDIFKKAVEVIESWERDIEERDDV